MRRATSTSVSPLLHLATGHDEPVRTTPECGKKRGVLSPSLPRQVAGLPPTLVSKREKEGTAEEERRSGAGMSGVDMAALFDRAKELDLLRNEQDDILAEINKIHKKLQTAQDIGEKSGDAILLKLRSLYARAKELSENEVNVSATLIGQLDALPQAGMSAAQRKKIEVSEQKKKRVKSDMDMTRVPSATIRNQVDPTCLMGEQVAARVIEDAEKTEWFVVKVMNFDRETKEFEVLDEDPGDDEEPKKYKLHMSHIIPFPKRGDLSTPDYPPGKHVLAVYPGTTALYKATVVQNHKRKTDDYVLEFDDDEEEDGSLPQRNVPFHRVVPYPVGHRQ